MQQAIENPRLDLYYRPDVYMQNYNNGQGKPTILIDGQPVPYSKTVPAGSPPPLGYDESQRVGKNISRDVQHWQNNGPFLNPKTQRAP